MKSHCFRTNIFLDPNLRPNDTKPIRKAFLDLLQHQLVLLQDIHVQSTQIVTSSISNFVQGMASSRSRRLPAAKPLQDPIRVAVAVVEDDVVCYGSVVLLVFNRLEHCVWLPKSSTLALHRPSCDRAPIDPGDVCCCNCATWGTSMAETGPRQKKPILHLLEQDLKSLKHIKLYSTKNGFSFQTQTFLYILIQTMLNPNPLKAIN